MKLIISAEVQKDSKTGLSRVFLGKKCFNAVYSTIRSEWDAKFTKLLPFTKEVNEKNEEVIALDFDGVKVYSYFNRSGTGKSAFFVDSSVVANHLKTFEEERAEELAGLPKSKLVTSNFDLSIVSSASEATAQ